MIPSSDAQLVSIRAKVHTLLVFNIFNSVFQFLSKQQWLAILFKINMGSLGSLGGEGNLRGVSIHDSTCLCEGCLEKRLADREFTIRTDNVFGEKDFGFNEGDEEGLDAPGEVIVLSDKDESSSDECSGSSSDESDNDNDGDNVSNIFDIYRDEPSDDAGYCHNCHNCSHIYLK